MLVILGCWLKFTETAPDATVKSWVAKLATPLLLVDASSPEIVTVSVAVTAVSIPSPAATTIVFPSTIDCVDEPSDNVKLDIVPLVFIWVWALELRLLIYWNSVSLTLPSAILAAPILLTPIVIVPAAVTGELPIVNSDEPASDKPIEVTVPEVDGVTFVNVISVESNVAVLSVVQSQIVFRHY